MSGTVLKQAAARLLALALLLFASDAAWVFAEMPAVAGSVETVDSGESPKATPAPAAAPKEGRADELRQAFLKTAVLEAARSWPSLLRDANYAVRQDVEFARPDGKPLLADLYRPRKTADTDQQPDARQRPESGPKVRHPAVLMIHGGAWMSGDKAQVAWHASRLAERGYLVMAINYRLAPRDRFPAQRDDCQAALRWLYDNADDLGVDRDRVAAYGYSAGGHLSCLLAFQEAHEAGEGPAAGERPRLKAVVAGGVPCGFEALPPDSRRLEFWLGGTRRQRGEVYRVACPMSFVSNRCPPAFLFHGDGDLIVAQADPERLHERLRECGVDAQWHVVEDAGHLMAYLDEDVFRRSAEFLDRHLQPDRTP